MEHADVQSKFQFLQNHPEFEHMETRILLPAQQLFQRKLLIKYLKIVLDLSEEQKYTWYQHWIAEGFGPLVKTLKNSGSEGHFCFGESLGLADVCLIPQVNNGLRFNCNLSGYPRIQSIWDHCMTLYPFKLAAPEAQPDSSTKRTC